MRIARARGTAVVGSLVVLIAALAACASSTPSGQVAVLTDTAATPDGVIAWNPLPPSGSRLPTTSRPASPDPAAAAGLPGCRASDLRVTTEPNGAMGSRIVTARFVATGDIRCTVSGRPRIVVHATGPGAPVPVEEHPPMDGMTASDGPVAVTADRAAVLLLFWPNLWCGPAVTVTGIDVVLPGGSVRVPGFGTGFCATTGGAGSGKAAVAVDPFRAELFEPPFTGSPLTGMAGDVAVSGPAVAGEALRGTLTLTSQREVRLDPCPDLVLGLYADGLTWTAKHALDCTAIAAADPDHVARLQADVPLRLGLEWQVPAAAASGALKVWVTLDPSDGPDAGPTFGTAGEVKR